MADEMQFGEFLQRLKTARNQEATQACSPVSSTEIDTLIDTLAASELSATVESLALETEAVPDNRGSAESGGALDRETSRRHERSPFQTELEARLVRLRSLIELMPYCERAEEPAAGANVSAPRRALLPPRARGAAAQHPRPEEGRPPLSIARRS